MRLHLAALCLGLLLALAGSASAADRALVIVEDPPPGSAGDLVRGGVMVVRSFEEYLLAAPTPDQMEQFDRLGLHPRVLDEMTEGKEYFSVWMGDAARIDDVKGLARVLYQNGGLAVVEAPASQAEKLAGQGMEIAKVFFRSIRPAPQAETVRLGKTFAADPLIQGMVDSVSGDSIDGYVQRLQDFGTRYCRYDSCQAAAEQIRDWFLSFGIDSVTFHDFSTYYKDNVVAVIPGRRDPSKIVLIGGHYDSYSGNLNNAPGADDNASGTACVLECARILSKYDFDYTLTFVAFCAEEIGLYGSEDYAHDARVRGDDIVAVVNIDMIGYLASGDSLDLDVVSNASSEWLRDLVMSTSSLYVPGFSLVDGTGIIAGSSDHASFWANGFDAIWFFEDMGEYSPYIHTAQDIVGPSYNSSALALNSIRAAVGLLATVAQPFHIAIAHTPLEDTEETASSYPVTVTIDASGTVNTDSLLLRYSLGGAFHTLPLLPTGEEGEFEASIPAQPAGVLVDYFLVAEDSEGNRTTHPEGAPTETNTFFIGPVTTIFTDDFESDQGWTVGDVGDEATVGIWERVDPNGTWYEEVVPVQPEDDHTSHPGTHCFVTGNAEPGASQRIGDVEGGKTTLLSPVFDLSGETSVGVRYYRWYTNDTGFLDPEDWLVDVSPDGGGSWVRLESLSVADRSWRLVERNLADFIPLTSEVRFRFIAADYGNQTIAEAAIDDFSLQGYPQISTGVAQAGQDTPGAIRLSGNAPNPFNPTTTIQFSVGTRTDVRLELYDIGGRRIRSLIRGSVDSGAHQVVWDGKNDNGMDVASGIYLARLEAKDLSATRKLVLLR